MDELSKLPQVKYLPIDTPERQNGWYVLALSLEIEQMRCDIDEFVKAAGAEGARSKDVADTLGVAKSSVTGALQLLREKGLERVKIYMGGVMAPEDAAELERAYGIHKVFLPDTPMQTIVDHMYASVGRPRHQP